MVAKICFDPDVYLLVKELLVTYYWPGFIIFSPNPTNGGLLFVKGWDTDLLKNNMTGQTFAHGVEL